MAVDILLTRNAGHPWDGRPGFDLLEVIADSQTELQSAITRAQRKHWVTWIAGQHPNGQPGGLLYKPSGAVAPWDDTPARPHPGGTN